MKEQRFKRRRLIRNRKAELIVHGILVVLVCAGLTAGLAYLRGWRPDRLTALIRRQRERTQSTEETLSGSSRAESAEPVLEVVEIPAKQYPEQTPAAEPAEQSTAEEVRGGINGDALPADTSGDWRLILVNPSHRLPEDFTVDVEILSEGSDVQFDSRAVGDLRAMIAACEAAGNSIIVRGSYRTMKDQQELFERKTSEYLAKGMDKDAAEREAATVVAYPGTSEHQLGLAADIVSAENLELESDQEHTKTQQWLMKNCWRYGFILRYPTTKSSITGIIYEPWHYRYVGYGAAKMMYEENLCFEEYLDKYGNETPPDGTGYVSADGTKGWEGEN